MITIELPVEFRDRVPAAQQFVDDVALRDPNWNGAQFAVCVGNHYTIDGGDAIAAATLYQTLGMHVGILRR